VADRSVSVRLLADVRGFIQGLTRADDRVARFTRSLAQSARDNEDAFNAVGGALTGIGLAAGAGFGAAVAAAANFDQKMSGAAVATSATTAELARLRDAAKQVGADTVFSAGEAAEGITELGKAGLSTADILGGALSGSTDLAAAGQIGLGEAAQYVAVTLKQFGLEGGRATDVADALTAGANLAVGEVGDLGQALAQSGQVSNQFGVSMEETVGTLAAFANAGLLGSDAGTSFKTMLQRLANPSAEAATLMDQLGISTFDAQGEFVGIAGVADQLQGSLSGLTVEQRQAALATIFGSDAVRAASVLYDEGGASIRSWTENVSQSGFAAEQASALLDNLRGDVEALRGSLDTALIGTGEGAQGPLRDTVQTITDLVNAYNDLPGPAQTATGATLGVVGAVGLAGGAAAIAIPQIVSLYDNLGRLGRVGAATQVGLRGLGGVLAGPVGIGLGVAVVALGAYAVAQQRAKQQAKEFAATLDQQTAALTDSTRAMATQRLLENGALAAAQRLGLSLSTLTDAALGNADAMTAVSVATRQAVASYNETADSAARGAPSQVGRDARLVAEAVGVVNGSLQTSIENTKLVAAATAEASGAYETLGNRSTTAADRLAESSAAGEEAAAGIGAVATAADDAGDQVQLLSDVLQALLGSAFDVQAATDDLQRQLNDLSQAAEDNGTALSGTTTEAISNRDAFRSLIESATGVISAYAETDATSIRLAGETARLKDQIRAAGLAAGYSAEEVDGYVAELDAIPGAVRTTIGVDVSQAARDTERIRREINSIPDRTVNVNVRARYLGFKDAQNVPGYAEGGYISGPGPKGQDSRLIAAAPGEYVLSASTVDRLGGRKALDKVNFGSARAVDVATGRTGRVVAPGGQGGGGTTVLQVDLRGAVVDRRRFLDELRVALADAGGVGRLGTRRGMA
jgi:TP901 family phage tail tape measure protein